MTIGSNLYKETVKSLGREGESWDVIPFVCKRVLITRLNLRKQTLGNLIKEPSEKNPIFPTFDPTVF